MPGNGNIEGGRTFVGGPPSTPAGRLRLFPPATNQGTQPPFTYGNWGGANWTGGLTENEAPVDALDQLFMFHDLSPEYKNISLDQYVNRARTPADIRLVVSLDSLLKIAPQKWSMPPTDPTRALVYGRAAEYLFMGKIIYQEKIKK